VHRAWKHSDSFETAKCSNKSVAAVPSDLFSCSVLGESQRNVGSESGAYGLLPLEEGGQGIMAKADVSLPICVPTPHIEDALRILRTLEAGETNGGRAVPRADYLKTVQGGALREGWRSQLVKWMFDVGGLEGGRVFTSVRFVTSASFTLAIWPCYFRFKWGSVLTMTQHALRWRSW
jgi:hypothetical protein